MHEQIQNEKPCLVNTPQGFSVSYKNKLLYSKYAPQKAILAAVEKLNVLPGTLFLCCSPVLPYGLKELCQKLDDKSFCVLCEFDSGLSKFSEELFSSQDFKDEKTARLSLSQLQNLPVLLNQPSYAPMQGTRLLPSGTFKRVVRLDFSAGIQFHEKLYSELTTACTRSIMTFWANRMTLVKFGRKYSQNFFKNLKLLPETLPVQNFFSSITKPIIVLGAGQSAEEGIKVIKNAPPASYFVLCVDTALQPLLENGIDADGVFIEEAQSVILRAFIGSRKSRAQIFAGLSAAAHLNKIKSPQKLSFFTTKYADSCFLNNLSDRGILPPENEPFGSVGLTVVYYALKFRASSDIPVYLYGLDFSYSESLTHMRGSMAHKERFLKNCRLSPLANYKAAFSSTSKKLTGKNGNTVYTSRNLKNYAELFNGLFANEKNLYDAGSTGVELALKRKNPESEAYTSSQTKKTKVFFNQAQVSAINNYFTQERRALEELRNLLTGKISLPENQRKARITELAAPREYLYLHFADGLHFSTDISFLKRIRTEIDFFLKFL